MMPRGVTSWVRDSSSIFMTFLSGWRSRLAAWGQQTLSKVHRDEVVFNLPSLLVGRLMVSPSLSYPGFISTSKLERSHPSSSTAPSLTSFLTSATSSSSSLLWSRTGPALSRWLLSRRTEGLPQPRVSGGMTPRSGATERGCLMWEEVREHLMFLRLIVTKTLTVLNTHLLFLLFDV